MELSQKILSDITVFTKYAKYLPHEGRRETWEELVTRNMEMHIKKFPSLETEIRDNYRFVFEKKTLPSMRMFQFSGKPVEINNSRGYNCSYAAIDSVEAFSEAMFLLLGGTGFGYSVQTAHIDKLPEIRKPRTDRKRRFLIGDSIEGWADSVKVLMKAYFNGTSTPDFDFSDIRPKGARLITSGGKAPGPQPLKDCLHNITKILDSKSNGDKLKPIEVHDILCFIADCVLAGGIRRAAMICLFDIDDLEMLSCKSGSWWELNPQRGRANNSAVMVRHKISKEKFLSVWKRIELSGAGEPGIFLTAESDLGTNPCAEISLKNHQFCNLTEINAATVKSQQDLNERAKAAAFIGTLQAAYTDFHYLRESWKKVTEKEALLGVSMTGIASGALEALNLEEASQVVVSENARVAGLIGINPAARCCTVKPAGTTSCVLGTSSGAHSWFARCYKRRMKVGKTEAIYKYAIEKHPEILEDDFQRPHDTAFIVVPQKAPENAILRDESTMNFLERVRRLHSEWIKPGHRKGSNTHNVSATVYVKPDEWVEVGQWMWENRDSYTGLSVLPYDGGTYTQCPFEEITEAEYSEIISSLTEVDLTKVIELDDETNLTGELACAGGNCQIS